MFTPYKILLGRPDGTSKELRHSSWSESYYLVTLVCHRRGEPHADRYVECKLYLHDAGMDIVAIDGIEIPEIKCNMVCLLGNFDGTYRQLVNELLQAGEVEFQEYGSSLGLRYASNAMSNAYTQIQEYQRERFNA